jgi:hypothetical protein
MYRIFTLVMALVVMGILVPRALAAVGCELNDPDRDIKRLFPDSTGYTTQINQLSVKGGFMGMMEFKMKLGDELDPVYEASDVPHSTYTVLKGDQVIGYAFGVNQKGQYGGMQIVLATDPQGVIQNWYYQRLARTDADKFRSDAFRKQFIGLSLKDFYTRDLVNELKPPSQEGYGDFKATIRGMRKDLIYFDTFILGRYYDRYIPK